MNDARYRPAISRSGLLLIVLFVTMALPVTGTAVAQTQLPLPDFSDLFVPEFRGDDVETIVRGLGIRQEQRVIVETLLADYETAFIDGVNQTRARIAALRPLPDDVTAEGMQATEEVRRDLEQLLQAIREAQADGDQQRLDELNQRLRDLRERSREDLAALKPKPMAPEETRRVGDAIVGELAAWRSARSALRDDFSTGLQTILDEDQRARWPVVERHLRRLRELDDARLTGESVDLIALARAMELSETGEERIAPLLGAYGRELDDALRARRAYLEDSRFELYRAAMAADPGRGQTIVDRELEMRLQVRAINLRHAEEVAASLSDAEGEAFRAAVRLEALPRAYRPTRSWRTLTAASDLEGLTATQRESISILLAEYRTAFAAASEAIYEATLEHEPDVERLRMLQRYGLQPSGADAEAAQAIQDAFRERADLDRAYEERLKTIIGDELFRRLPD